MKKNILGLILILAIFIAGCGGAQTTGKAFIGGTSGVSSSFLVGTPPATIIDGARSPFAIVIKLENKGEADIEANKGYVQIIGLEKGAYIATGSHNFKVDIPALSGAKKSFDGSVRNGATGTVEFPGLSYKPEIQGDQEQTVWAETCYNYYTQAVAQLCVKSNAEQVLSDKKICEVEGEKKPQNSGAPIQVTSLKQSFAGTNKIAITMVITHMGASGNTFYAPDEAMCSDVESNNQRGEVKVEFKPITVGGKEVTPECTNLASSKTVKLYKDKSDKETTTIYCTIDTSGVSNVVEVPLEAKISYKYLEHIEQKMTIRHVAK